MCVSVCSFFLLHELYNPKAYLKSDELKVVDLGVFPSLILGDIRWITFVSLAIELGQKVVAIPYISWRSHIRDFETMLTIPGFVLSYIRWITLVPWAVIAFGQSDDDNLHQAEFRTPWNGHSLFLCFLVSHQRVMRLEFFCPFFCPFIMHFLL